MTTFAPDQTVALTLDPRRGPREATIVAADREGFWTVTYTDGKTGQEVVKTVAERKLAAVATDDPEVDAPAVDDVPVVEIATDAEVLDAIPAAVASGEWTVFDPATDWELNEAEVAAQADRPADDTPAPVAVQGPHTQAECEDLDGCAVEHTTKPVRAARAPKRAPLPEGMVTAVGLAKVIDETGRYTGKSAKFTSQMLYAIINKDEEWPGQEVNGRPNVVTVEAGLAWWDARAERLAEGRPVRKATRVVAAGEVAARLREAMGGSDVAAAARALAALVDELEG